MELEIIEQINRASARFLQPLSQEEAFEAIIEEALELVKGDIGYIALNEKGDLKIKYAYPYSLGSLKMRKRGFSYRAFKKRIAYVTYAKDFEDIHPELIELGIQSTIFIPLSNSGRSIGVMNVMSKSPDKKFSKRELSILKLFGSMVSLVIHKAQLYTEIKSALESRDLFLSMAAHELRTPTTTISGYAQLLKNKIISGAEKRWVDEIYKELQRLTRLVNELLEVNRIRLGQFQYHWRECNLSNILDEVVDLFKVSHPARQIRLEKDVSGSSLIIGDRDKIMQVLINVLDNALKFSSVKTEVEVSLKSKKEQLVIQIKDQGHGIAKKDLTKVFEGFYQGANPKEGMGLGLYLSYQIVKKHKGEMHIQSKINKGTKVEIIFPRANVKRG